eukprot:TRINITY_DN93196_c0_g1_i1.p1 TRINITY_DN93196_c0_g1~~TRINITY_DN93196_c0_g1_i1.p1  ORF type:complete len:344 (-),score=52.03 TRINITY_DN93196_c0_g1_i1:321-1283(-)
MASLPQSSSGGVGPVVTRRVGGNALGSSNVPNRTPAARLKPSVRETIESITSTGSQSEFFKPEQTIILFDWDDTLCPSNWIRENRPALSFFKPCPPDEKYQRPLRELQKHVEATLRLALKMGKVVIVTNAMEPWVETSCRNFLPALVPIVSQVEVIYARSVFETMTCDAAKRNPPRTSSPGRALPGLFAASGQNKLTSSQPKDEMAPQRWKEIAFEQEITGFYSRYDRQSWKNVISIGDSIFERDAVRRVVVNRPTAKKKCRTKTAKLLDEPEIDELVAQVRVIHDALALMVQYDGNLDIEIDEEDLKLDLSLAEKIMDR